MWTFRLNFPILQLEKGSRKGLPHTYRACVPLNKTKFSSFCFVHCATYVFVCIIKFNLASNNKAKPRIFSTSSKLVSQKVCRICEPQKFSVQKTHSCDKIELFEDQRLQFLVSFLPWHDVVSQEVCCMAEV